jgi:hypothetical protein
MAEELAINIQDIEKEIAGMSQEDMAKDLLSIRVRQKVQQKKHYNPEKMKLYQQKGREKGRLLKERALKSPAPSGSTHANLWEHINAQAEAQAEAQVTSEASGEATE